MKRVSKKISWLVLGAIIIFSALVYFCPMTIVRGDTMVSQASIARCESLAGNIGLGNAFGLVGCSSVHFAVAWQKLAEISSLTNIMNFLSLLILSFLFVCFAWRDVTNFQAHLFLTRLRCLSFWYRIWIKLLVEARLFWFLNILDRKAIVSLS